MNSDFYGFMRAPRLVAYGKPNPRAETKVFIAIDLWRDLSVTDWSQSTLAVAGGEGPSFHEVRIYPALLAPGRADLVAGYSLSEAFRRFVLEDPEVAALAREGIKFAPQFEAVFERGRCFVYGVEEWPVDSHRWATIGDHHPDPKKRSGPNIWRDPDPIEIVIAADALIQRYRALIEMLRRRELEAYGIGGKSGTLEKIPASIWCHEDFHMSAQGDVLQASEDCEDPPRDWLKRRWVAVDLALAASAEKASVFHGKPTERDSLRHDTTHVVVSSLRTVVNRRKQVKRPVAEPLAATLKKLGLDKSPGHRSYKQVAAEIAHLMPGRPSTEQEIQALSKAVARHYRPQS
jgi:hypothetical protein